MLALVEAAEAYDATRRVKFSTFARHRILGALRDVQRRLTLERAGGLDGARIEGPRLVSLSDRRAARAVGLDGDLADPPVGTELEATDEVERWLRKLPKRHAAVCREIYLNGCSQVEAAQSGRLSRSRGCPTCIARPSRCSTARGTSGRSRPQKRRLRWEDDRKTAGSTSGMLLEPRPGDTDA